MLLPSSPSHPSSPRPSVPWVLPFWSGERSPGYHLDARGTLAGLTLHSTRADILQGLLEGVSFRLVEVLSLVRGWAGVGGSLVLIASGGGLDDNPYWCQLLSALSGAQVLRLCSGVYGEATSRGVALYMWRSLAGDKGGGGGQRPGAEGYLSMLEQTFASSGVGAAYASDLSTRHRLHRDLYERVLSNTSAHDTACTEICMSES